MVSSAPSLVIRHKLLPKQDQLIFSNSRHTMYSGAVGAGKSQALCLDALIHCAGRTNTRYGLFRKTRAALMKSTIKTLIEGNGDEPPVLPHGSYKHNKNESEIRLNGGGSILYSGIETPESIGSMNLTRAGVDELIELQADDYNAVDDRVRVYIGEPFKVVSATNPGPPSHWAAKMFGLSPDSPKPALGCQAILTQTSDNTYLHQDYIDNFERHKGTLYYDRMFLGLWCGSDGVIYKQFRRDKHVRTIDTTGWDRVIGVDDGVENPFTAIDIRIGIDDHFHVAHEVYETGMHSDSKRAIIKELASDGTLVVVDSAASDLILSLQNDGINAIPCAKGSGSVLNGINLVQTQLANDAFSIDERCVNTIREFESYEWDKNKHGMKDKPCKRDDHAMDPIRYVVRHRLEQRGTRVVSSDPTVASETSVKEPVTSFAQMREDEDWGWE